MVFLELNPLTKWNITAYITKELHREQFFHTQSARNHIGKSVNKETLIKKKLKQIFIE